MTTHEPPGTGRGEDDITVAPLELIQIAKKQLRPTSRLPFLGITRRSLRRAAARIERRLLVEHTRADRMARSEVVGGESGARQDAPAPRDETTD